jgi:ABC-type nickel/cobalt efflux system permease component RcnA
MASVMMMAAATLTVVAVFMLWQEMRLYRRVDHVARGTTTALGQTTADAAEDSTIRRYREHRVQVEAGLTVSCGRCGSSQIVHPHSGMHRFALVCWACNRKTLFRLPGSR